MPLLPFPDTRQSTSFSCGAAAVQSVLYYYGTDWSEGDFIEELETSPEKGTSVAEITAFFQGQGLKVTSGQMDVAQLRYWVDRFVPVIVLIQAWADGVEPADHYADQWGDGHYVVVIGYDEKNIYFDDPSILDNRGFIPVDEFMLRWHDVDTDDTKYVNFGIAVYGKPPTYNPASVLKIEG